MSEKRGRERVCEEAHHQKKELVVDNASAQKTHVDVNDITCDMWCDLRDVNLVKINLPEQAQFTSIMLTCYVDTSTCTGTFQIVGGGGG